MRSRAWHLLGAIAATAVVTVGMAGGAMSANAATTPTGSGTATPAATTPALAVTAATSGCANFTLTLTPVSGQTAPTTATSALTITFGDNSTPVTNNTLVYPAPTTNSATAMSPITVNWPANSSGQATTGTATVNGTYTDSTTAGATPVTLAPVTVSIPSTCTVAAASTPLNVEVSNQTNECSTFHVTLQPTTPNQTPAPSGTASVALTYTGSTETKTVNLTYPSTSAAPADVTVSWPTGATAVSNTASITPTGGTAYQASSTSAFSKPACTATAPATVQSDLGAAPKGHSWVTGAEIGGPAGVLILGGVVLLARRRTRTTQA